MNLVLGLAATFALVGGSQAAILVDNFESYNSVGDDMNGKGGWTVTNGTPAISGEGPVVIVDSYTWDVPIPSNRSATVGGVAQTTLGLTSLSHVVTVPLAGTLANPSVFKFETAYTESLGADPRNNFRFVLNSDSGNLLTIDLTADIGTYNVSWSSDFATGALFGTLGANIPTQFQLNTWWNGSAMEYSFTNSTATVMNGTFSNAILVSETSTSFAVNWDSTGGAGGNSITVDNVSMIPEPSSALLFGLAGLGLISRRRRA